MHASRASFWSTHRRTILALLFGLAFSATLAYAVPPQGGYGAGDTLDPDCAPGDTDCIVQLPTYTFSTGLTNTSNTVTNDLSTGVSGGQIVIGGTGAAENLTLTSTSNATKGKIIFGTSAYDEVNNRLGIGTATPSSLLSITQGVTVGTELVTNGTFTGNASGWSLGDCATYGSNQVTVLHDGICTNAGLSTTIAVESGKTYSISLTVSSATDQVYYYFDNIGTTFNEGPFGNGTHTVTFSSDFTGTETIHFESWNWDTDTGWTIDTVSIKEITDDAPILHAISNGNTSISVGGVLGNVFIGEDAGLSSVVTNSNFMGTNAGSSAISASSSNFFGAYAGNAATNADNSNFLGANAGNAATNANDSNFFGFGSGYRATNADNSNFFGTGAGNAATNASNSNFFGLNAGYGAATASDSNFFGTNAGNGLLNTNSATFIGTSAGSGAFTASYATLIGYQAGFEANTVTNSIFVGQNAGNSATNSASAIFLGLDAGRDTANAGLTIAIGQEAGSNVDTSSAGIFIGYQAGINITDISNVVAIGLQAGMDASDSNISVFIGREAGKDAVNAGDSVFIGHNAGLGSQNASQSNFIGVNSGLNTTGAYNANFFGHQAGNAATDAHNAVFIGYNSGQAAANAANSIFLGQNTGTSAANAANSIFIGRGAGSLTQDVSSLDNSAAYNETSTFANTSILIGHNTSTGGFSNSIAIGAYATNSASNEFMIGSTTRRIETLVFNSGSGNTCSIVAGSGISCSSDERLKTNIEDLETDTLDKLLALRTVRYNWNTAPDGDKMIGFIAQDLESPFPELIMHNNDGMLAVNYAQMTPILVEALREINAKIVGINDIETDNNWRTALVEWFASATNGIGRFFAREIHTETICVKKSDGNELCLNGDQLQALTEGSGMTIISNPETPTETTPTEVPPEIDSPETEEVAPAEGEPEVTLEEPQTTVEEPAPESDPVPETPTEPAPAE